MSNAATKEKAALAAKLAMGEDSMRQFKRDATNADALAAEMAAFANGDGGTTHLGVYDEGGTPGLSPSDVKRLSATTFVATVRLPADTRSA
jgi:ATP-dependent DNA helicase RecG